MKIHFYSIILLFLCTTPLFGQFTVVSFDAEISTFNDNKPLPAETTLIITGSIPDEVHMVEIAIFNQNGKDNRPPLYVADWRRPFDKPQGDFRVPLNYRLPASKKFDFKIIFFERINSNEQKDFYEQMTKGLDAYINQTITLDGNKFKLDKNPNHIIADMNELVETGMTNYRSESGITFPGFSDIIYENLANLKKIELPNTKKDTSLLKTSRKTLRSLQKLIHNEVAYLLSDKLLKRSYMRYVDNYETESKAGYFAINAGYGAVSLGGKPDNLDYDTAPYLGLGFPLSTSRLAPGFLRNSSLSLGLFLEDLEDKDGNNLSGPIIGRPIYFGLDFKLFQFIRFNAGAVLLEKETQDPLGSGNINQELLIQPFIGLSGKVNIRLFLDK